MNFKFLYFGIILFLFINGFSQNYTPIDTADDDFRSELKSKYETIFQNFNIQLKSEYSGKKKNQLIDAFNGFQEEFIEEINDGNFIKDSRFQKILDEIITELQSKNPEIPKNLRILLSKYPNVNAYALPDGTLVMNMGCFKFLENEDQLASIISHEIAHNVLQHVMKSQIKQIDEDIAGKYEAKIKNIKQRKYGQNQHAFELMQNLLYEEGNMRRTHEKEADSLGFRYFQNSRFKDDEFVNAFKLLQRFDTIKPAGLPVEVYRKYFDLPHQKFNEEWLEMEDFSRYDYSKYVEKINKDSIASHPEAVERIESLQKQFPKLSTIEPAIEPNESFKELQKIAQLEEVPNMYFLKHYGMAVFVTLLKLEEGADEQYYKYWLGRNFEKIYEARKAYKLNRYLDTVNPQEQSESYQQFLSFIWNLSLDELKNIADFYLESEV
ncbi:MAG TPA: M48 family metallopeptidase [Moheibacter sp.]|nr:M48 family metallopeptidase [Moheibacter sp.]